MPVKVNVGGVWKDVPNPKVNVGGVWKTVSQVWVNVGGVWKTCLNTATYYTVQLDIYSGGDNLFWWARSGSNFYVYGASTYTETAIPNIATPLEISFVYDNGVDTISYRNYQVYKNAGVYVGSSSLGVCTFSTSPGDTYYITNWGPYGEWTY